MMLTVEQWLAVAQVALASAAAIPGVDPKLLALIQTGLDATKAGLSAVQVAQAGVDPSKLGPIDIVP